jgi:hypothetical protein
MRMLHHEAMHHEAMLHQLLHHEASCSVCGSCCQLLRAHENNVMVLLIFAQFSGPIGDRFQRPEKRCYAPST